MRQARQIEAISQTKGTSSNIGQNGRRRKDYFGAGGKFVNYVKLLCKLYYVNHVNRRIGSSLFGSKKQDMGPDGPALAPYLACTRDYDPYSPLSRNFLPRRHFRDFHHAAPAGLFPPDRLSDRRSGVPAFFPGSAPQQARRTGAAEDGGCQVQPAGAEGRVAYGRTRQPRQQVRRRTGGQSRRQCPLSPAPDGHPPSGKGS